jgi:ribosome maturation factor RimP
LIDKQALIDLLEPVVGALGYELVDLDVRLGRNGLLRLYIDRPADEAAPAAPTAGTTPATNGSADPTQHAAPSISPADDGTLRAEDGVTLGDCELVSGQVSAFLDVEDPLPGSYTLEVSSPGLDRRLRTRSHFERFVGSEVKVELKRAAEGQRRFRGTLKGVEGDEITVGVDGTEWHWNLTDIAEARLVPRTEL